jgi:hypothetical protein
MDCFGEFCEAAWITEDGGVEELKVCLFERKVTHLLVSSMISRFRSRLFSFFLAGSSAVK